MTISNNSFTVTGTLAEPFVFAFHTGEMRFFTSKLSIRRYSGTIDTIPILVPARLCDNGADMTGKRVLLSGCILSRCIPTHEQSKLCILLRVHILLPAEEEIFDRNEIILRGNICQLPLYRITPRGREITTLLLAVPRRDGKNDYIPLILWGGNARIAGKLTPGDTLSVQGRIQSREYQKKLAASRIIKRTAYEVSICLLSEAESFKTVDISEID